MKIYVVQNVARQVEGDLMLVQVEKGFLDRREAEEYLRTSPRQKTEVVKTDAGEIECFCVRGVYEVDVESQKAPTPAKTKPQFTAEEIAKIQNMLRSNG